MGRVPRRPVDVAARQLSDREHSLNCRPDDLATVVDVARHALRPAQSAEIAHPAAKTRSWSNTTPDDSNEPDNGEALRP